MTLTSVAEITWVSIGATEITGAMGLLLFGFVFVPPFGFFRDSLSEGLFTGFPPFGGVLFEAGLLPGLRLFGVAPLSDCPLLLPPVLKSPG